MLMALKASSGRPEDLLITAIRLNDLELVKKFVEQGADVNATWPFGYHSIFSKAVENGNIEIVRYLISKKTNLKKSGLRNTYTPLIVAITSNLSLPLVQLLVDNGADVDEMDISGRTPLNAAISLNKDSVVECLLKNGANVNQADASGRLPITLAVKNNRFEIVKLLTLRGADINRSDSTGDSALTLSQTLSDFSILNYLEIFSQRSFPSYSVRVALQKKDNQYSDLFDGVELVNGVVEGPEIVSFVVVPRFSNNTSVPQEQSSKTSKNNAKYEEEEECVKENFLDRAISNDNSEEVELFLQINNINKPDEVPQELSSKTSKNNAKYKEEEECVKDSSLDRAILNDNLEEVELFLQNKNINKPDEDGFTPLAKAILFGKTQIVKLLLTSKADTCKKFNGKTPLFLAVEKENLEIIKLLLEHGAEHTIQTAFFEAINLGNLEIIKYFIERGVELNVIYKNGYTPLIKSLELRNFKVVKELVESGANVNMPDGYGKLPLTASFEIGDQEILSYFYSKGATLGSTDACFFLQKYVESGNLKMLKLLVEELKVNVDSIFDCGFSPLTKSVELENFEMVEYLVSHNGASVNTVDGNYKTPLAIAAKNQNLPLIKFLISSGADTNLASEEIEEYASLCEDFALYLDIIRGKYTKWK